MQTKPLIYGLIGFFVGGLIVAVAATTFDKPESKTPAGNTSSISSPSMEDMTAGLKNKTGDDFDKSFINDMIIHHEGAVEMAKLSAKNAKHEEIKRLSEAIITAQEKEISELRQWRIEWGYDGTTSNTMHGSHGN